MACQVKVVARSAAPTGEIITTVECRYWALVAYCENRYGQK